MIQIQPKFTIGDTVYLIRQKPLEIKCPLCDGEKEITYKNKQLVCPHCKGNGFETSEEYKSWYTEEDEFKVHRIRVTIYGKSEHYIKFKLVGAFIKTNSSSEKNIFATRKGAEVECNIRNKVIFENETQ